MSDALTYMNELTRWPDAPPLTDQWLEALAKACDMLAARDNEVIRLNRKLSKLEGCDHAPNAVTTDILEGDSEDMFVQWCQLCGSYRRGWIRVPENPQLQFIRTFSEWTEPKGVTTAEHPDWD